LLRWRRDTFARVRGPVLAPAAAGVAALLVAMALMGLKLLPLLGMGLAGMVAIASVLPLRGRSLRRLPLPVWGMVIAHFGMAVALFGIAADSAFTTERLVAARVGETTQVGPWRVSLRRLEPVAGPNWTALQATLSVSYKGGAEYALEPQARTFWAPPQQTSESALLTRWNGQLYTVLGGQAPEAAGAAPGNDRWQLRLWWKPFVTWIWYGGALIGLGGLISLVGRVWGDLTRRSAQRRITERREERTA
jgi:cytochrome c-type biogenesis protein CcmF